MSNWHFSVKTVGGDAVELGKEFVAKLRKLGHHVQVASATRDGNAVHDLGFGPPAGPVALVTGVVKPDHVTQVLPTVQGVPTPATMPDPADTASGSGFGGVVTKQPYPND